MMEILYTIDSLPLKFIKRSLFDLVVFNGFNSRLFLTCIHEDEIYKNPDNGLSDETGCNGVEIELRPGVFI